MIDATRELLSDAAAFIQELQPEAVAAVPEDAALPRNPLRVMGYAANGVADELALVMLAHVVADLPIAVEITATRMQPTELVAFVRDRGYTVICVADLPPSPASKTRYLVRRLHAALPEVRILIGRWSPPALADESAAALREAGATLVTSQLIEMRTYFGGLLEMPRVPQPTATPESRRTAVAVDELLRP